MHTGAHTPQPPQLPTQAATQKRHTPARAVSGKTQQPGLGTVQARSRHYQRQTYNPPSTARIKQPCKTALSTSTIADITHSTCALCLPVPCSHCRWFAHQHNVLLAALQRSVRPRTYSRRTGIHIWYHPANVKEYAAAVSPHSPTHYV
jgi:hypothetical protein